MSFEADADVYARLAEFHDLFMPTAWERLRPVVRGHFGDLGPDRLVVELGAGSGIGTRVIAEESVARIHAVEPSLTMRSILTARVADDATMTQRVTVRAGQVPGVLADLNQPAAGVVCAHMIGHLGPDARRALINWLATWLTDDGVAVVTTQDQHEADVAESDAGEQRRRLGEYEYRAQYLSERDGRFATRYQVWHHEHLIRNHTFDGAWAVVTAADLAGDLEAHELVLRRSIPGVATIHRR